MTTGSASRSQSLRDFYQQGMEQIRADFQTGQSSRNAGFIATHARAVLADEFVSRLWRQFSIHEDLQSGVAIVAVGGYGRSHLYPSSDLDILYLLDNSRSEAQLKDPIRRINQEIWDAGIRAAPAIRLLSECESLIVGNPEFTLSLLDHRFLVGDRKLYNRLDLESMPRLLQREHRNVITRLLELTQERHAKYAHTLFHLEPNIKDCPGGLRDLHVCQWLTTLYQVAAAAQKRSRTEPAGPAEFLHAAEFLATVRCFLHYAHERDDNTLYWSAQDAAAEATLGLGDLGGRSVDASVWMRSFFRNARTISRRANQLIEEAPLQRGTSFVDSLRRKNKRIQADGYYIQHDHVFFDQPATPRSPDPVNDPDIVLNLFEAISNLGCQISAEAEDRLESALPNIAAHLEEGPALWKHFRNILNGPHAGRALRAMHALGILEIIVPEFLGVDALVIRDAYHRYTVDEHTFVLIDTLHALLNPPQSMPTGRPNPLLEWQRRFGELLKSQPHPELLYLAALMHDVGKGRETPNHSLESSRMAKDLFARMELDAYESGIVNNLIVHHLALSSALRRDIFDSETLRLVVEKIESPEQLQLLALLTFADIAAVHPDALTPWKAENLWNLYVGASNFMDRTVDDDRVQSRVHSELIQRVTTLEPASSQQIRDFLQGFPQRYLRTHTPEQILQHFHMASRLARPAASLSDDARAAATIKAVELSLNHQLPVSEVTLVALDRSRLFATIAGGLSAWGMDIVNAEAFSNANGVVVDNFSFIDRFRTLELNPTEHKRFLKSLKDALTGAVSVETLIESRARGGRRRVPKVKVETHVQFDQEASSHSTLLQVIAQDVPGLLRAISLSLAEHDCNIEVALIDTEGETAIDVFYVTRQGEKLDATRAGQLRDDLVVAIAQNPL